MARLLILTLVFTLIGCNSQLEGRPDEPAPVDGGFRSDSPDTVATTGRPQLVELYAEW